MARPALRGLVACALSLLSPVPAASAEENAACPAASLVALADRLPSAQRFRSEDLLLRALLEVWLANRPEAPTVLPDSATIFAFPHEPLLVALTHQGCIVDVFTVRRSDLWRLFRDDVGPAV